MFDPRPLCCSSLTTAVGGTTDTNFVDSAHPTVARITMPLRRSQRERRPALPDDYVVYSGEIDYDIGEVIDPVTFLDAVHSPQYDKWNIVMKEEMLLMANNDVWELVEMPENFKPIGCKWVLKPRKMLKGKLKGLKLD